MKRDGGHSVEVLLRQALRAPIDLKPTDECLDAEALATWAEGGLLPAERRVAEAHVADCSRCQAVAAALIRTTPNPPAPEVSWFRSWNLRWLVPLTVGALGVAIWFALPDQRRPKLPIQDQGRPEATARASRPSERSDAASDERLLQPRPSVVEPNPSSPDRGAVSVRTEPSTDSTRAAERSPAKQQSQVKSEEKLTAVAPRNEPDSLAKAKVGPTTAPSATSADAAAPSPAAQAAAAAPPAALPTTLPPTAARSTAAPLPADQPATPAVLGAATAAPNANAAEPTATSGRRDQASVGVASVGRGSPGGAAREIQSPDGSNRWRIVGRGSIQRSTDAGASWETLQTDSTAELMAGSAPTPGVCWLVGRAGIVLLSSDGRRFTRLSFPSPSDLVAVQATDARTAAVTTVSGQTYRTSDGGTTWELSR